MQARVQTPRVAISRGAPLCACVRRRDARGRSSSVISGERVEGICCRAYAAMQLFLVASQLGAASGRMPAAAAQRATTKLYLGIRNRRLRSHALSAERPRPWDACAGGQGVERFKGLHNRNREPVASIQGRLRKRHAFFVIARSTDPEIKLTSYSSLSRAQATMPVGSFTVAEANQLPFVPLNKYVRVVKELGTKRSGFQPAGVC